MNNNISVLNIQRSLKDVLMFFDPEKETYKIIMNATLDNMSASSILSELSKIGSTNDYSPDMQDFFYNIMSNLRLLEEQDRKIESLRGNIINLNQELILEFSKRNVSYNEEFNFLENVNMMTYEEKKNYIFILEKDLNVLKDKISSLKIEKKTGEDFGKKLEIDLQSKSLEETSHNENMKKINEDALKNYVVYTNPLIEDIQRFYTYSSKEATDHSKFNVSIEYKEDSSVELKFGYKGDIVDENQKLIICYFSDSNSFNKDIYPYLVNAHIIDGGISGYERGNDSINSENVNGEGLEISGSKEIADVTENALSSSVVYEDDKDKSLEKGNARVRKFNNEDAFNLTNTLYIIIFACVLVIILCGVFLYFLNR